MTVKKLSMITLNFYYRRGCHLCDDMLALLTPYQSSYPLEIIMHDIDEDVELKEQYGLLIPVLTNEQGQELCHYFFDQAGFEQYISETIVK